MEISENREILRKNIKELTFDYRKRENSNNILEKTRNRIKSLISEMTFKKMQKNENIEIETLLILDGLEFLFMNFLGKSCYISDFKEKLEDYDKKAEDYKRNKIDASYFLARMCSFQEKFPDFINKTTSLVKKYRDFMVRQGTLINRFQDLTLQVLFIKEFL